MSSSLLFSISTIVSVYGQNGCSYFGAYSTFNGQFDDSGLQNNGKNYYVMDNSDQPNCNDPVYIFYNLAFNKWYLHTQLMSGSSISYYYYCDSITDINDVFSCTNWKYSDNSDVGVFFTSGNCEDAICATISLDVSAGSCSSIMNYLSPNQFTSGGNAPYLIYNEKHAKWMCVSNITANWGCQAAQGTFIQSNRGFISPFKDGDIATYSGNTGDVQFTCTGAVSLAPTTSQPTKIPTEIPSNQPSNNPSKTPSNVPSDSPTDLPSKNPTSNPSNQPSETPTNQPSKTPTTTEPSVTPTNVPSQIPSNMPTRIPLEPNQTHPPSKSPTHSPITIIEPTTIPTPTPTRSPLDPNETHSPSKSPTKSPSKSPTKTHSTEPYSTEPYSTQFGANDAAEEGLFGVNWLKLEYLIIVVVVLFCCFLTLCLCCFIRYRNSKEDDYPDHDPDTKNQTQEMMEYNTNNEFEQENIIRANANGNVRSGPGFDVYS